MANFYKVKTTGKFELLAESTTSEGIAPGEWATANGGDGWIGSWDMTEELAKLIADTRTQQGKPTLFVDRTESVSPRYSVCDAPVVGSKVSKAFNGDSYPEGVITKVSKSMRRVETSTGMVFYRRKETAAWVSGRTWSMIAGHHSSWNPSF